MPTSKSFQEIQNFARNSAGWFFDVDGVYKPARVNYIRNNTMLGVIAGSPGTIPTNWAIDGNENGLTRTIVGVGVENGISYIDVQWSGTPTATSDLDHFFETGNGIGASNGQTWTGSVYLKLVSGTLPGTVVHYGYVLDSSQTFINLLDFGTLSVNSTLTRFVGTGQINTASATYMRPTVKISYTLSVAVNFTIRIGMPQLELGLTPSTVAPTVIATSGAPRRAYDPSCYDFGYLLNTELVTNGPTGFANTTGIAAGNSATIAATGNELVITQAASSVYGQAQVSYSGLTVGKRYRLSIKYSNLTDTTGGTIIQFGTQTVGNPYSIDTFIYDWLCTSASGSINISHSNTNPIGAKINVASLSLQEIVAKTVGTELAVNGSFSADTNWTKGNAAWTISGGTLNCNGSSAGVWTTASDMPAVSVGKTYRIIWTVTTTTAGSGVSVGFNGTTTNNVGGTYSTSGTFIDYVTVPYGSTSFFIGARGAGTWAGSIDNISIQEVMFRPVGVMSEDTRTNMINYTENLGDNTYWNNAGSVTAAAGETSPTGATAALVTFTASGTRYRTAQSLTAGIAYTSSLYMKWVSGATNLVFVACSSGSFGGTGGDRTLVFSGINGGWVSNSSEITSYSITRCGNGWFRVSATYTPTTTNVTNIGVQAGAANVTAAWGAQIEQGSIATSYIPNPSATYNQRVYDNIAITGNKLTDWFTQYSTGAFVIEYEPNANSAGYLLGSAACGLQGGQASLSQWNNITTVTNSGPTTPFEKCKVALSYIGNKRVACINGSMATIDNNPAFTTAVTGLYIGSFSSASGNIQNGAIRTVKYYKDGLTEAAMRYLTAN